MLCEGVSFQNFTGDKLTAWGYVDSNLPGELDGTLLGSSEYAGEVIPLNVDIPPGNNL